jgi:hypothetical protein
LNSSAPVGPLAVLPREERREHDHVAEDEDPEPVRDDDAFGGRSAAAFDLIDVLVSLLGMPG